MPGITLYLQPVQDLTIEDRVSRTQFQFSLKCPNADLLDEWVPKLVAELQNAPELSDVASDLQARGLQAYLNIDRDAASRLGISVAEIDDALYGAFGQRHHLHALHAVEPIPRRARGGAPLQVGPDVPRPDSTS